MKVKTSELIGPALDWAVAKCEGVSIRISVITGFATKLQFTSVREARGWRDAAYHPSTSWAQGGPIIEREYIALNGGQEPCASILIDVAAGDSIVDRWIEGRGPTPLIAAMRCYVGSQMGDEVDVPEELI